MSPQAHEFDLNSGKPLREGYDTAQICMHGHCVNSSVVDYPRFNEDYCSRCGQPTITECRECRTPIRGYLRGSAATESYAVPTVCHQCGAAYPWTKARLATAKELAAALEALTPEEHQMAATTIDDLVYVSTRTPIAAVHFKRLMAKAGDAAAGPLRAIVMDIASETAKKALL